MNIFNNFKRGLAAVLSLSVALSAIFVFHYPLMKARAEDGHNHPICGDGTCGEHGDSEEWTVWAATDSLPTDEGHYYLTDDVEITETWAPEDNTYLCLNGHSITLVEDGGGNNDESDGETSGGDSAEALESANAEADELESTAVIYVTGNFTLCDCSESGAGTISHSSDLKGSGVDNCFKFNMYGGSISDNTANGDGGGVYNRGTFNMYGGSISGNTASGNGGGVDNRSTFNMYGGSISDNKASGNGGGVHNISTFNMYGGTISGNEASGNGDGVYNNGTMTVGGTAAITGNTADNVYLPSEKTISLLSDNPLRGKDTKIGVTAANFESEDVPITNENDKNYRLFFSSDKTDYHIIYADKTLKLSANEPDEANEEVEPENPEGSNPDNGDNDDNGDNSETHTHNGNTFTAVSDETELKNEAGNYYLTENITLTSPWSPAENTHLCLNGHTLSIDGENAISVDYPNFTLCDCEGRDTAGVSVSVGANGSITVGGKLKAEINLSEGKRIGVDILEDGAEINVKTATEPTAEKPIVITSANGDKDYSGFFSSSNENYEFKTNENGEVVLAVKTEQPPIVDPTEHIHPVCGDNHCKECKIITWTKWTSGTSLPAEAGCYYLTTDVALGERWNVSSDIKLCLNGYTITSNVGGAVVYVSSGFELCDCAGRAPTGAITHAGGFSGRGVYIAPGGAFTMYGGAIRGNIYDNGAGVYNDGVFTMRGGSIVNNEATGVGGGLFNRGFAVVEGDIYGNNARHSAGGVYQDGKLTVNNSAYIMGNTANGSKSNVYLTDGSRIIIGSGFDGEVGVTPETNPKSTGSVTIAKGTISSKTLDKIKSDSSSLTVKRSGDTLTLSRKTSSDDDDDNDNDNDDGLELDIKSKTSSQIPIADRTAIFEMLKTMPDWIVGAYFDITLYDDDAKISEHKRNLDVELTIPSSIRAENRVYKVIRVHNGEATLLDDVDNDPNTITVRSRYFSTYAIVYSVAKNAAANGNGANGNGANGNGAGAGTGAYGNPSMGVQNEIPIAGLACGFTVLALAAPGKKIDN